MDVNNDGIADIVYAGNFYPNSIHSGRNDADFGGVLLGSKGKGFSFVSPLQDYLRGEVRKMLPITVGGKKAIVVAKNNDRLLILGFSK